MHMGLNDAAFCRLPARSCGYCSIVCENGEHKRESRATWQVTGFGLVTGFTLPVTYSGGGVSLLTYRITTSFPG